MIEENGDEHGAVEQLVDIDTQLVCSVQEGLVGGRQEGQPLQGIIQQVCSHT